MLMLNGNGSQMGVTFPDNITIERKSFDSCRVLALVLDVLVEIRLLSR